MNIDKISLERSRDRRILRFRFFWSSKQLIHHTLQFVIPIDFCSLQAHNKINLYLTILRVPQYLEKSRRMEIL